MNIGAYKVVYELDGVKNTLRCDDVKHIIERLLKKLSEAGCMRASWRYTTAYEINNR